MFRSIKFRLLLPLLIVGSALWCADARADFLVEVDMSDLSAVTFTTTEAFAEGSFSGTSVNGITLEDFLTGNSTTVQGQDISSTIAAYDAADGSTRRALNNIWIANYAGGYTPDDVSFYDAQNRPIYSFDDQRALTGEAVFDFSSFEGLPSIGTVGNVLFDTPEQNQVVGQWRITAVPEPSAGIMLSLGALLLIRRRK